MRYIISCLFLLLSLGAGAQYIFSGKVTDGQTNEPLAGATIKLVNGETVTSTDNKGVFEIKSESKVEMLEVSFIGYQTQKVKASSHSNSLQVEMMSVTNSLKTVTVTGYENNRKLLETAGSIALLTSKELQRGDNMDIMAAINTVPGVKMEASVPGSYRISIRGSLLRSPWGIRNVKIYWNDIPLTSPDGSASHAVDIDPSIIGSLEVIKGPAGSIYGAGNGGVLLFKTDKAASGENYLSTGVTAGSFGFNRFTTSYKLNKDNFNIGVNYIRQRYDGYRQNGWSDKDAVNIFSQLSVGENRKLSFFINHAEGSYGLSGSLDSIQVAKDPRQAGQFSRDNKTSVKKYIYTSIGLSQVYKFNELFTNTSSIYGTFQTLDHPYGESIYYNGYLKESTEGFGGRTKFSFAPTLGSVKSRFSIGAEAQYQHQFGNTFDVTNDIPGTWPEPGALQTSDIVVAKSLISFAQAAFDLPASFFLTLGASYNHLSYNVTDLRQTDSLHTNYTGNVNFKPAFSPRIALVKKINNSLAVHASVSYGFSPPTSWEANNGDGSFNKNLQAEKGINYEAGIRGTTLQNKLNFDVSAYQMNLTNAILPQVNQYGTESFINAGATTQKGLEVSLSYLVFNQPGKGISLLKPWITYSYNHYRFKTYVKESFDWNNYEPVKADYSNNKLTGITPNTLNGGVDLETGFGLYFNMVMNYIDATPINDANTYYQDAYTLLASKIGFRKQIKNWGFEVFAGGNNLLDESYTSLINLNADANANGSAPKFFNPSPGRNFYTGVSLKFNFIQ